MATQSRARDSFTRARPRRLASSGSPSAHEPITSWPFNFPPFKRFNGRGTPRSPSLHDEPALGLSAEHWRGKSRGAHGTMPAATLNRLD